MQRVTGIGGIFFKSDDPEKLYAWYEKHLGLKRNLQTQAVVFPWRKAEGGKEGMTLWSLFPRDTKYFEPSQAAFMLNYRVDDLDAVVAALRAEGVEILGREDYDYGRFAWILDPEGNRIELWEPAKQQ
jgi:catechol 2,3-dioxygenase-like lactoylglutathione lyase family enzyme